MLEKSRPSNTTAPLPPRCINRVITTVIWSYFGDELTASLTVSVFFFHKEVVRQTSTINVGQVIIKYW